MRQSNIDSMKNLQENLILQGVELEKFPHVIQFNKRDLNDLITIEELDESANPHSVPFFEAVAIDGVGVQETLEGIVKLVMRSLRERYEPVAGVEGEPEPTPLLDEEPQVAIPAAAPVAAPPPEPPPVTPVQPPADIAAGYPPAETFAVSPPAELTEPAQQGQPSPFDFPTSPDEISTGVYVLGNDEGLSEEEANKTTVGGPGGFLSEALEAVSEPEGPNRQPLPDEPTGVRTGGADYEYESFLEPRPNFESPASVPSAPANEDPADEGSTDGAFPDAPSEFQDPHTPGGAVDSESESIDVPASDPSEFAFGGDPEPTEEPTMEPWIDRKPIQEPISGPKPASSSVPPPGDVPGPVDVSEPLPEDSEEAITETGDTVIPPIEPEEGAPSDFAEADGAQAGEDHIEPPRPETPQPEPEPVKPESRGAFAGIKESVDDLMASVLGRKRKAAKAASLAADESEAELPEPADVEPAIARLAEPHPASPVPPQIDDAAAEAPEVAEASPEPPPVIDQPSEHLVPEGDASEPTAAAEAVPESEFDDWDVSEPSVPDEVAPESSLPDDAKPEIVEPDEVVADIPLVEEIAPETSPEVAVAAESMVDEPSDVWEADQEESEQAPEPEPGAPAPATRKPFTLGEGDPFAIAEPEPERSPVPVGYQVTPVQAPDGIVRAEDNQLHLRLQGTGAIAESGQVRALDIEVPVPGSWVGNRRVTLQLRLTLTPAAEEEDGGSGGAS
jgi:hypothetical protein